MSQIVEISQRRRRLIVKMALSYLQAWADNALDYFEHVIEQPEGCPGTGVWREIELGSERFGLPTIKEMEAILKPRKKGQRGNNRTRQILALALSFLQAEYETAWDQDFIYEGGPNQSPESFEHYVQTHVSFEGHNLRKPSEEELNTLLAEAGDLARDLPPIARSNCGFHVFSPDESEGADEGCWTYDKVFCNSDMSCEEVRRSVVEHDGYHPGTVVSREE